MHHGNFPNARQLQRESHGRHQRRAHKKAENIIKKQNRGVLNLHALLGQFDLALLTGLPDTESAMKVSIELGKATGIGFTTLPAVEVQVFDKLAAGR